MANPRSSHDELEFRRGLGKSAKRMSVATSDGRMEVKQMEKMAGRRVSLMTSMASGRASVATSDARLLEFRRDDDASFLRHQAQAAAVEQEFAKPIDLRQAGRFIRRQTAMMTGKPVIDDDKDEVLQEGQSTAEAVLNLLNNCLGSGMLAIAFCISKAGIIPSFILIALSILFNRTTLVQIIKTCKIAQCDAASATIGEIAVGKAGRLALIVSYTLLGYFCMVSYVNATTDSLTSLVNLVTGTGAGEPYYAKMGLSAVQFKMLVWAVVLVPTTFIRSLKGAAVMSLVSFAGAGILCVCILINCGGSLMKQGLPSMDKLHMWPASTQDFLDQASVFLLLYSIQAGGGMILANLKDDTEAAINKTVNITFSVAFFLEILIGLCGYFYFLDSTTGDLLTQFPDTDPVANVGRVAVLLLVVPGYMMMVNPCRMSIIQLLFDKNEALHEASFIQFLGVTLAIDFAALGLAIVVLDLSAVFAISGSFVTPFVAFILPAVFTLAIRSKADEPDYTPIISLKNFDMYAVLVFGLTALGVFGSMTMVKLLG
mmetsp:Transcript_32265/g.92894  ORF Transcript_32265/g.92894 Transcript_32265/m.92894 type:complete len:542 (+) Transcript_32265:102-1727(+)